jgi:hypothetical protein
MYSETVEVVALNQMTAEGSGNIPTPITFLFIETLNKYFWKYASFMHGIWLQTRLYSIHLSCGESTTKFRAGSDRILASCLLSVRELPRGMWQTNVLL